ncbi:MAG: carboxypeptidase-like regulatory domain-containing protein, partial [Acidobacteriota bacterium]
MWRPIASAGFLIVLALIVGAPAASAFEVTGRVLDERGRPVEGAEVDLILEPSTFEAARAALAGNLGGETVDAAATTADGWFTATAPEAGFYRVRVAVEGYAPMVNALHPLLEDRTLYPLHLKRTSSMSVALVG